MVNLKKIKIQGVRSVGPTEEDQIEIKFKRPFTLISGQNGAGKTTIIESLKYATSGAFPPGTKNAGGWIHHPQSKGSENASTAGRKRKAANITKIPASIYLEFESKNKSTNLIQSVQVRRNIEGTLKDGKMTIKSLEGTITVREKKSQKVIESRNEKLEELNKIVRSYLGVNKPVLEYAVFCHQDDTLWPFEEAKNLKAKFDDIFQSTEYVKALEQIKKSYKAATAKITVLDAEFNDHNNQLIEWNRRKERIQENQGYVEKAHLEIKLLTEEIDAKSSREQELDMISVDHAKVYNDYILARDRDKEITKDIDRLKSMEDVERFAEMYENSAEALEEAMEQCRSGDDKQTLEKAIVEKQKEKKILETQITDHEAETGRTKMKNKTFIIDRKELAIQFQQAAETHLAGNINGDATTEGLQATIISEIVEKEKAKKNEINTVESEKDDTIRDLQNQINSMEVQKAKNETTVSLKKTQVQEKTKKISEIQETLDSSSQIAAKHSRLIKKRNALESDYNSTDWDVENKTIEDDLTRIGDEKDSHQERKEQLEEDEELAQKKSELETDLRSKTAEVQGLTSKRTEAGELLTDVFNKIEGFPELDILTEEDLKSWLEKYKKDAIRTDDRLRREQAGMHQKQTEERMINKDLVKIRSSLVANREKIENEFLQDLPQEKELLSTLVTEESELQEKVLAMEQGKKLFRQFLNSVQKKQSCPVCSDKLTGPKLDKTLDYCRSNMQFKNGPEMKVELEELQSKIARKKVCISILEQIIKDEMEEDRLEKTQKTLKRQIATINEEKSKLEKKKKNVDSIRDNLMHSAMREFKVYSTSTAQLKPAKLRLSNLENELIPLEDAKDLFEVREGIKEAKEELKALETQETELRKSQSNLNSRHRNLNSQLTSVRDEITKLQKSLGSNTDDLIDQKTALESEMNSIKNNISILRKDSQDLDKSLSLQGKKLMKVKEDAERKLKLVRDEYKMLHTVTSRLSGLQEQHGNRYKEFDYDESTKILEVTESKIISLKEEVDQLSETIGEFMSRRGEFSVRVTKLEMAKNYVGRLVEKEDHGNTLLNSKKAFKKFRDEHMIEDMNNVQPMLLEIRQEKEKLTTEKAKKEGQKQVQLENIAGDQMLNDQKPNMERDYVEAKLRLQVEKSVCRDLDKFYKGLDASILEIHKKSMEQLNAIIDHLWKNSYQGIDIESISISTKASGTAASTRKSYEYNVVMLRPDGAALPMRGRASAGQRMLASLVIRLALVECFCTAGILSLDEPTTNLDKQSIRKFAEMVTTLAHSARGLNLKTQFVIITHDKEFTDQLKSMASIEFTYQLEKNDKGYTTAKFQGEEDDIDLEVDLDDDVYSRE